MKDKTKIWAIILCLIALIVVIVSIFTKKEESDVASKISVVDNYSNFYTVDSCLYRTITYLSTDDEDSIYLLLSDNYKKSNNIKKNDVLNLFYDVEENSNFVSKKMYYQTMNKNITKYYVYGQIEPNQLFDNDVLTELISKDVYFIVYLDTSNKTFSIEPYNGDIFNGGELYE